MIATLSLISLLAVGQPPERSDYLLTTRLGRAQELVYKGTYDEQSAGGEVEFRRTYWMQASVIVLESTATDSEVAFLTILRQRGARGAKIETSNPSSVRLELMRLDSHGHLKPEPGVNLAVPLEGPPTIETGAVMELPARRVSVDTNWDQDEPGRPAHTWTVVGTETVKGTPCLKIVGIQKSEDWETAKARADRAAWRRQDTVWLEPRLGVAYKVERRIERRDAGHKEPGYHSVLMYELDSQVEHLRETHFDLVREIKRAHSLSETAAPLLLTPAKYTTQIDQVLESIKKHLENSSPTPYREATLHLQRRLESARRGDAPPTPLNPDSPELTIAAVGRPAPDFIAPDMLTKESIRFGRWKGKPMLLMFYSTSSPFSTDLLQLARDVQKDSKGDVAVVILVMSNDPETVRKQWSEAHVSVPTLDGRGLRQSYDVKDTPKMLVVDADGVIRGAEVGWGRETRETILDDLRLCKPRKTNAEKEPPAHP
jgi:peroxiredoxin